MTLRAGACGVVTLLFGGNRLERNYHLMKQPEHSLFCNAILGQTAWTAQCMQNELNGGTMVSIEPGGRGVSKMVQVMGGPFT